MNLNKSFITLFILLLSLIYIGCSTSKKEKTRPKLAIEKIPPGHAEINGEITKILPIEASDNPNDPCSKAPCFALVKVKGISYGAGFQTINMNEDIKIRFAFTLEPTSKDLFPNMEEKYPGLKIGDNFTALVAFSYKLNETKPNYEIFSYTIK